MAKVKITLNTKENELVAHIKKVHVEEEQNLVFNRHDIGEMMDVIWPKKYGTDRLGKVAKESGMTTDLLKKCYQFAKNRTREQVEQLQGKPFPLSFRLNIKSITIDFDTVVKLHQDSKRPKDFEKKVDEELKKRKAKAEMMKSAKADEPTEDAVQSDDPQANKPEQSNETLSPETVVDEKMPGEQNAPTIEVLKNQVANLQSTINRKDEEIANLKQQLEEKDRIIVNLESQMIPAMAA